VTAYTTLRQKNELTPAPPKSATEAKSDLHKEMSAGNIKPSIANDIHQNLDKNITLEKNAVVAVKASTNVQKPTPQSNSNLTPTQSPTKNVSPPLPQPVKSQTDTNLTSSTQNRANTTKVNNKTPGKESSFPSPLRTASQPTFPKSSTSSISAPSTPKLTRNYALSAGSSPRIVHSPKRGSEGEDISYRKSLDILITHTLNALKNISDTSAKK
jgi:hypothetical protein